MILIVTNKRDLTADYLILELKKRHHDFFRFNTEDFPQKIQITWKHINRENDISFSVRNRRFTSDDIGSTWFRRPISPTPDTSIIKSEYKDFVVEESTYFLEGIWKTLSTFWVSKPENIRKAESKLLQIRIASQIGLTIPETIISNIPSDISEFSSNHKDIIYKPMKCGRITYPDQEKHIFTNKVTKEQIEKLHTVSLSPSIFQVNIPKIFDIRVTVIGKKVFAAEIHSQENQETKIDWRRNSGKELIHKIHYLPEELSRNCIKLVEELGLEFGALDFVLTPKGEYYFLEINPNGQWAWIQQLCPDLLLRESLADLLIEQDDRRIAK
jgi:glutathione synthase/RimK-type ligase-like ATP-grasp enzyme